VLLPKGGEPHLYMMDYEHCRLRMTWMEPDQIHPRANFREKVAMKRWKSEVEAVTGSLDGKTVGVDLWSPIIEQQLKEAWPKTEFVDGYYDVLMRAKIIKTQDELACLRLANALTEAAMDAALRVMKPGIKECEVLAEAWRVMTSLGSEWSQCSNIVTSGPYTAPYRRFTSDRIIQNGDAVIIDIGAGFNGYWGDLTRVYICGNVGPTQEMREAHQKVYNAVFDCAAATKPGATNADVYAAANGHALDGALGHGAGVNPWEMPFFSPASKDEPITLQENMVFNIEPYYGEAGKGGIRLEKRPHRHEGRGRDLHAVPVRRTARDRPPPDGQYDRADTRPATDRRHRLSQGSHEVRLRTPLGAHPRPLREAGAAKRSSPALLPVDGRPLPPSTGGRRWAPTVPVIAPTFGLRGELVPSACPMPTASSRLPHFFSAFIEVLRNSSVTVVGGVAIGGSIALEIAAA
jgi:Xaa-Pro aminopeptidase